MSRHATKRFTALFFQSRQLGAEEVRAHLRWHCPLRNPMRHRRHRLREWAAMDCQALAKGIRAETPAGLPLPWARKP